jgi:hypothetical protein
MSQAPLNDLSEAERALAFERFELLRPSLEELLFRNSVAPYP